MPFSPGAWLVWLRETLSRRARFLGLGAVVAMTAFWLYCGLIGIDFGFHWDEDYEAGGVRASVNKMMVLPQWYVYGNVYFLVGMGVVLKHHLGFLPAFLHELHKRTGTKIAEIEGYATVQEFQRSAAELISSPRYVLETREAFLWLSCLTGLWVYLILRKLYPQRYLGPLAATAFIVCSWEIQYHARFIAMDTLVTQLIALELLFLVHALLTPWPRTRLYHLCGAAVAAGLAFSCKAPGLVGLLPVVLLPFLVRGRLSMVSIVRRTALAAFACFVAGVTTLLVQPAILVDPLRFIATLGSQSYEYKLNTFHPSYTTGALNRLLKFLAWLWLALPSPYPGLAVVLSVVALFGLGCLSRRHLRVALLGGSLAGPLFLMMILHPLFIVRQYLMLSSLLAIGFGLGLMQIFDLLGERPWLRRTLLAGFVAVFFFQGRFLYAAAEGIRDLTDEEIHRQAAAELLQHPRPIRMSPRLTGTLAPLLEPGYRCVSDGGNADPDLPIVIRSGEHAWHANDFGFAQCLFGSREVNYDWYPTWVGQPRRQPILILTAQKARDQKLAVEQYTVCEPNSVR